MKLIHLTTLIEAIVALLCSPVTGHAAGIDDNEFSSGFVSALGGLTLPQGYQAKNTSARAAYGLNADYKVLEEVGLGGYLIYNGGTFNDGSKISFSTLLYGVEADYFWKSGISLGLRLGLSTVSFNDNGASVSTNPFSFGPRVSYDYHFPYLPVSVGADASVMFVTNTKDITTGEQNSFFVDFNGLFSVKYWFN